MAKTYYKYICPLCKYTTFTGYTSDVYFMQDTYQLVHKSCDEIMLSVKVGREDFEKDFRYNKN